MVSSPFWEKDRWTLARLRNSRFGGTLDDRQTTSTVTLSEACSRRDSLTCGHSGMNRQLADPEGLWFWGYDSMLKGLITSRKISPSAALRADHPKTGPWNGQP